jgi:hypothetical protein
MREEANGTQAKEKASKIAHNKEITSNHLRAPSPPSRRPKDSVGDGRRTRESRVRRYASENAK